MDDKQRRLAIEAFREAVGVSAGQSGFARETGAKQQSISNWLRAEKPLPGEYVLAAERATGVSRHRLRPDLYPVDQPPSSSASSQMWVRDSRQEAHFARPGGMKREAV